MTHQIDALESCWYISPPWGKQIPPMVICLLEEGDCIAFDNKQPHGIERVVSDRWCVCFFRLKAECLE